MYKYVVERPIGYMRPVKRLALYCDKCGQRIVYSSSPTFGLDLCEDCYTDLKKSEKQLQNIKRG